MVNFNDLINKYKGILSGTGKTLSTMAQKGIAGPGVQYLTNPQFRQTINTNYVQPIKQGIQAGIKMAPPVAAYNAIKNPQGVKNNLQTIGQFTKGVGALTMGPGAYGTAGLLGTFIKQKGQTPLQGMENMIGFTQQISPLGNIVGATPLKASVSKLIPQSGLISKFGSKALGGVAQSAAEGFGYGAITGQNPIKTAIQFAPYGAMGAVIPEGAKIMKVKEGISNPTVKEILNLGLKREQGFTKTNGEIDTQAIKDIGVLFRKIIKKGTTEYKLTDPTQQLDTLLRIVKEQGSDMEFKPGTFGFVEKKSAQAGLYDATLGGVAETYRTTVDPKFQIVSGKDKLYANGYKPSGEKFSIEGSPTKIRTELESIMKKYNVAQQPLSVQPKGVGGVPKELEPLVQEAKKFKSATEFEEAITNPKRGIYNPDRPKLLELESKGMKLFNDMKKKLGFDEGKVKIEEVYKQLEKNPTYVSLHNQETQLRRAMERADEGNRTDFVLNEVRRNFNGTQQEWQQLLEKSGVKNYTDLWNKANLPTQPKGGVLTDIEKQLIETYPRKFDRDVTSILRGDGLNQREIIKLQNDVIKAYRNQDVVMGVKSPELVNKAQFTQPKGVGVTKPVSVVSQKPPVSIKPQEGQIIKSTIQTGGITKPTQIVETPKLQGNQLGQKQLGVGGTKQLAGAETSDTIISRLKSKTNRIYTDVIDRFHPLSATAKMAGKDQEMRNALTGHYGAGSTAQYHVDFELSPILKEQNIDELRKVSIAQRDIELAGRGIKGSNKGFSLDKLKQEMGQEKFDSVKGTLDKLYKYQDEIVKKYLVDTGIISKDAYSTMRANNQFYVPFKRVMDTVDDFLGFTPQTRGAGSVGSQNVIFKIKGSDKQIIDPIESILESTYKSVGLGKRQQVAQTIVSLKDKLPKGMIQELKGPVGNTPNISLFVNGKVKHYSVPMEVAEAAKGLKEESLNTIVKILSVPTQVFRATATGINPEFMAPNIARDVQSAFVNVGLNPFKWTRGVAHMMKKNELYKDFLKYGGKTSRISIDRPMLTKTVRDITKGFTIKKPSDLLKGLQVMGEYSEQPTRIAVFEQELVKGLKQGLPKDEAAIRAANWAQDSTVNFARRGAKTQSVNAIYAFLNARAQGVDRLIRTFKNDPIGGAFRVGFITQVPAIAGYAWNRQFDSYYDDRVVSPTDRRTNFIIMLSDTPIQALGGAQFIKIPKGDIGRLANPTEEFLRFAENKGGDVKKALFDIVRGFSPWDNIGDLIPTALRPPIEAVVNKSFFTGYPIVPEYKTSLPPKYQDSSYTSPLYRMLGQKMGVSPAKLQAVVEGYGTGISKMVEMSTRGLVPDKYKTAKNEQGADINKTPIVRRFLGGEKRTQEEQLKTDASKVSSINFQINDVKSAIKRGDIPQDEGIKEIQKLQQEQSKIATKVSGSTTTDNKTWVLTATGGLKEIDLSFPMPTLKTSTSTLVNKEYLADYRGQLTTLKNEVMVALDAGKITEADAEKAIAKINSARVSTTTRKVPKPSLKIKALKLVKLKTTKVKKITVKRKKLKKYALKTPKLKKSKIKLSANLT